jgi:sugar phosphate isomerase/epimerase
MDTVSDRRAFLVASCAAAVGSVSGKSPASHAIAPIARPASSHFKFSLAAYCYRDLFKPGPNQLTIDDFLDDCARFDLDGAELTSYYLPASPSRGYLCDLKGAAFKRGLDVSGTAIANDFCHPPGERRDHEIAHVKQWIEYADRMDAPAIRIFSGNLKPDQSIDEARQLAIDAINECCAYAGKYGVFLALENHHGLTTEADDMLAIVRAVQSPWFGVNMDTGNFATADVYGDLAKIAPFSLNVQIKVAIQPSGKPQEPSDYSRLAEILRSAGYRGYVALEFDAAGDPRHECERHLRSIRKAFAG